MPTLSQQESTRCQEPKPRIVNCDQECWIKDRIKTAILMAFSIRHSRRVSADDTAYRMAMDGLIHGTAVEIIQTLGMTPEFTNLRRPNTAGFDPAPYYGPENITQPI